MGGFGIGNRGESRVMDFVCREITVLLERLKKEPELDGIRIVEEFPAISKPCPLKTPVISLGLNTFTAASAFAGEMLGWDNEGLCTGRQTKTVLLAGIYTPILSGGQKCREVLVKLLRAVCSAGAKVGEIRCGSTRADRNAGAYVIDTEMEIRGFSIQKKTQGISAADVVCREGLI